MSRVIKFRAWDGSRMIMPDDKAYYQHYLSFCGCIIQKSSEGMDCFGGGDRWRVVSDLELMQFTGLTDKNGAEIYEGDLLNIYFTSSNGEWIHDCIYRASIGNLGDIQFEFVNLLWFDGGKNQYPSSTTLCQRYSSLDYEYKDQQIALKIPDSWQENHFHGKKWKGNDKSFYFEVIGNIYQNPELLK